MKHKQTMLHGHGPKALAIYNAEKQQLVFLVVNSKIGSRLIKHTTGRQGDILVKYAGSKIRLLPRTSGLPFIAAIRFCTPEQTARLDNERVLVIAPEYQHLVTPEVLKEWNYGPKQPEHE